MNRFFKRILKDLKDNKLDVKTMTMLEAGGTKKRVLSALIKVLCVSKETQQEQIIVYTIVLERNKSIIQHKENQTE